MNLVTKQIPALQLKVLLYQIKDSKTDVCVRVRLLGKLWENDFLGVGLLHENTAVLSDEKGDKTLVIQNLNDVIQFELDKPFHGYEPFYHYGVSITDEFALAAQ